VKIKALKNDRQAQNDFSADFSHQPVSLHADSGNFRLFNHGRILPGIAVSLDRKGLDFPNQELVDYWDFMYYSFTIAMCYQTSDVSVESVAMRRMTLFHSILSFILVAVVIGLVVNIISNLI